MEKDPLKLRPSIIGESEPVSFLGIIFLSTTSPLKTCVSDVVSVTTIFYLSCEFIKSVSLKLLLNQRRRFYRLFIILRGSQTAVVLQQWCKSIFPCSP